MLNGMRGGKLIEIEAFFSCEGVDLAGATHAEAVEEGEGVAEVMECGGAEGWGPG